MERLSGRKFSRFGGYAVAGYLLLLLCVPAHAQTLSTWNTTTSYPIDVDSQSCVVNSGYVYCVGGSAAGGSYYTAVYYAPLSSSGVGSWAATTSYPGGGIATQSCVANSGYIYCIGGTNVGGNPPTNTVYYAPLSSSGVGSWTTTNSYPIAIMGQNCVVNSGYVYCIGGESGVSISTNVVYYAPLSSSGVGSWTATTSYPIADGYQSCVVNSGYVYCVAGYGSGYVTNAVYYAPLSSSGVGSWTATTSYPTNIDSQSCGSSSSYIYCVGGVSSSMTNAVYYAPLSSSGVGSWTATTSYPIADGYQSCVVNPPGYMYCIGGIYGNGSSLTNAVYYAGIEPPTPSNLSATTLGASSITWTWSSVSGATSYDFYPSTGGAPINLSGTTFTQTNLSTNTSYGAQVSALDSVGASPLSALVSTYTLATSPTNFAFTQVNISSITVSWGANTNPSGTSYQVQYWQPGGSTTSLTTTAMQEAVTSLQLGASYYLTVNAVNGDGVVAPSGIFLSTTTLFVPATPTGLTGTVLGVSSITWTWNAVSSATGYDFYPSTGGSPINLSGTTFTQTELSTNTAYGAQVSALDSTSEGALSAVTTSYTLAASPTNFAFTQVNVSSITVSWNADTNPASTTSYHVEYWQSTGSTTPLTTTATQETITGLSSDTTYYLTVNAVNGDGIIAPSEIFLSTKTLLSPPTQTPSGLNAVLTTSSTINWAWNSVPGAASYDVFETTSSSPCLIAVTTSPIFIEINLASSTVYSVMVRGFNNGGAGPFSSAVTADTLAAPISQMIASSGGNIVFQPISGPDNLQIPPGAYSQNIQITLQTPSAQNLTCNASPAENLTPTDIALEVDLNPDIEPVNQVTVSLSYANASIGSMNPEQFVIARCDPTNNTWTPLPSTIDTSAKTVTATSDHLSVFQIMSGTPPTSVSQYKVGPNPLRPALGESQMKFIVPPNSNIKIYTLTGELVSDITAASDGTAAWNATNRSGRAVASGVYFVLIRGNGQSKTIKVIVQR